MNAYTPQPKIETQRPLKIALLGYRSHPFVGGQGIYLHYLSKALAAYGHTVHVYSGPPYPDLAEGIKLIKIPSLDLYAHPQPLRALRPKHLQSFSDTYEWWSKLSGSFAEPYVFGRRVAKHLRNADYDIIHDNQSLCSALIHLQKKHTVVATIHHPIHRDRELALQAAPNWKHRFLIRRWYNFLEMQENVVTRLNNIITVSESSKNDIADCFNHPHKKISVITNGIDTSIFKPLPAISKNPWRLITTASADQPLKGLIFLLRAHKTLLEKWPKLHLVIIGKLKKGGEAEKQLQKLGLQQHVQFKSELSTQALVEEYNQAAIAICPSLYEGFGMPAAEAMACGVPCITTDGGALPEVVGDAGLIVPAGDDIKLAEAIDLYLTQHELKMQTALSGKNRIRKHFSWQTVAHELTDYYRSILNSH